MHTSAPRRSTATRRRGLALLLSVLVLTVTACSDSTDPQDESAAITSVATASPSPDDSEATRSAGPPDDSGATSEPPADDSGATSAPTPAETAAPTPEPVHAFGAYGVAAGHPAAVKVGIDILERGGNAVDAAVATAFAMGVIEPLTSGVGGGGAALVVPMPGSTAAGHPDEALSYDYREVVQDSGTVPRSGTGVPGFVAGMFDLHQAHGQLSWREVLQPAIDLAEFGVPTSWWVAQELRTDRGQKATQDLPQFVNQALRPLEEDDPLVQTELADTLETIAREGRDGFYTGYLSNELRDVDGITKRSLMDYEVDVRAPVSGEVNGHLVMAAAPALSGIGLIQMLQVAESHGIGDATAGTAAYIDILSDAWLVADESIETVLGDPNFVDVPSGTLTDPKANAKLAPGENRGGEASSGRPADGNTTHLSVVDGDGLTVSMTNTITDFWGSTQEVGGFFVNNHLLRFGSTGRTQANDPAAGKRPISYMAPAVVLDAQQRPVLAVGSPGGKRIPSIQATVISRWLFHDQALQSAVDGPRFHLSEGLLFSEKLSEGTTNGLEKLGYDIHLAKPTWNLFGSVQALELDHDRRRIIGATDDRRTGAWDSGPGVRS